MSAVLQAMLAAANQEAAVSVDMNEAVSGGGGKTIPAGRYLGRVVEYVDLGAQPQEYQGKAKDPANEFRLGIALWGQGVTNEDGTPYVVRPYALAVKRNEKAGSFLAFKTLKQAFALPQATHFAQFLGGLGIFTVEDRKTKAGQEYTAIDLEKTAPAIDIATGQPYQVPEIPDDMYLLFLWNNPTLEAWDRLFIDGVNDKGKSKNFIQNSILGAVDFEGSPLHQLLLTNQRAFSIPAKETPVAATQTAQPAVQPAAPSVPAKFAAVPGPLAQAAPASLAVPAAVNPGVPIAPITPAVGSLAQSAGIAIPSLSDASADQIAALQAQLAALQAQQQAK